MERLLSFHFAFSKKKTLNKPLRLLLIPSQRNKINFLSFLLAQIFIFSRMLTKLRGGGGNYNLYRDDSSSTELLNNFGLEVGQIDAWRRKKYAFSAHSLPINHVIIFHSVRFLFAIHPLAKHLAKLFLSMNFLPIIFVLLFHPANPLI